jgi:hypothetical protein
MNSFSHSSKPEKSAAFQAVKSFGAGVDVGWSVSAAIVATFWVKAGIR